MLSLWLRLNERDVLCQIVKCRGVHAPTAPPKLRPCSHLLFFFTLFSFQEDSSGCAKFNLSKLHNLCFDRDYWVIKKSVLQVISNLPFLPSLLWAVQFFFVYKNERKKYCWQPCSSVKLLSCEEKNGWNIYKMCQEKQIEDLLLDV